MDNFLDIVIYLGDWMKACWFILLELSSWYLLGILISGLFQWIIPSSVIPRHLGNNRLIGIFKAILLGIPLPLCSCGVIPVAFSLRKQGASRSSTMAFLITTPQIGINSVMVSAGFFGWGFVIFKVIIAIISGLVAGCLELITPPSNRNTLYYRCSMNSVGTSSRSSLMDIFHYIWKDLFYGIWKWLLLGILFSGLIVTFFQPNFLKNSLLGEEWVNMILVLIMSLPLYICAVGSVPLAASLVYAGFSPGSALILLLAGPASNLATMGSIYKLFGLRGLINYLGTLIMVALMGGLIFNHFFELSVHISSLHQGHGIVGWDWRVLPAILLLMGFVGSALLDIQAWLKRKRGKKEWDLRHSNVVQTEWLVENLSCENCARHIYNNGYKVPNLVHIEVDIKKKIATFLFPENDDNWKEKMVTFWEQTGYSAKLLSVKRQKNI